MMPDEFSPEEKLLRLIRGEKKQQVKPEVKNPEAAVSTPEARPPVISHARYQRRVMPIFEGEWDRLKVINLTLIIFLVSAVLFLVYDLISSNLKTPVLSVRQEAKIKKDEILTAAPKPQEAASQSQVTPFSSYQQVVGKRELFKPLRTETPAEKASRPKTGSANEKLKDLSLIGIVAGEKPQAVIEDKKIQKTFFLYEGQMINDMQLEKIAGDRVILDFEGEKIELVL